MRDPNEDVRDCGQIDRGPIAVACKQLCDARAPDQVARKQGIESRKTYCAVGDHFSRNAAVTEKHDRSEHLIGRDPDDELVRVGTRDHRRNGEAFNAAFGLSSRKRRSMTSAAACTACASCRFKATPPTSDLCEMSGEWIFSAIGKPISLALLAASAAFAGSASRRREFHM